MNTMPDNTRHNRGRAKDFSEMTFRTPVAILCAGLLLLLGCATVKGPAPGDIGVDRTGRIAVLPISNLSNSPAPLAEIRGALLDKLKGQGINVMEPAWLERLMERIRMRDTGGLSAVNARAFKEDAEISGVLITSLEFYKDRDPPKLALSARLVTTGDNPEIKWADSISLTGDDAPGLLGLGLIEDPKVLLDRATAALAGSLASFVSGRESDYDENNGKFKPKVDYVSPITGVGLREVFVSFALRMTGRDESLSPARIDVSLSAPSPRKVTVEYAVTGGTAENGKDYTLKNGTLVFEPGELFKSIDIEIIDDKLYRADRTIEVTLSKPVNAVLGNQTVHTYTIIDNDPPPSVTFTSLGQEVQENGGSAVVTVQLSAVSGKDVIVPFTMSGTAVDGKNYRIMTPNPFTIKAGTTIGVITVALMDNKRSESNRTIIVALSIPVNAVLGSKSIHVHSMQLHTDTIQKIVEDSVPEVNFVRARSEEDEGTGLAKIDVSLSTASGKQATVEYAVTGGTAVSGKNYVLKSGTLVFEPGETTGVIDLAIIDDKLYDDNKTIEVTLLNPINAVLGKQTVHTYTIIDNNPEPTVTFTSPGQEVQENGGSAVVTMQLSAASGKDVIVPFTVGGTAVDGKNYRVMTPNPLTIRAGETTGAITLALMVNKKYEDARTIIVTLGKPVKAALGESMSHRVTVLDADAPPRIAIMPFTNESISKYAGEIMVQHFLRELIKGKHFTVVEPGLVKEKLLAYRIIMYDGVSLSDAHLIAGELQADLILTGRILDYREKTDRSGKPKVGFSLLLMNRKNQQVVWSSSSRNEGDDAQYLFDWGKINTVHTLAAEMASAVGKMIMQR